MSLNIYTRTFCYLSMELMHSYIVVCSTPEMSKMHADETSDLRVVAQVLKQVYGVCDNFKVFVILVFQKVMYTVTLVSARFTRYPLITLLMHLVLKNVQIQNISLAVRKIVWNVCDTVALRGARLAAAGVVGILKKIGRDGSGANGSLSRRKNNAHENNHVEDVDGEGTVFTSASGKTVVAMDGGLYEHYTKFRTYLQTAVVELLGEGSKNVVIELSKDGSGIGAALLAASISQYVKN